MKNFSKNKSFIIAILFITLSVQPIFADDIDFGPGGTDIDELPINGLLLLGLAAGAALGIKKLKK